MKRYTCAEKAVHAHALVEGETWL